MHLNRAGLIALASLCAMTGCRPPDLTPDQAIAKEQVMLHSEEESGQATVIFAQQELRLAERKQANGQNEGSQGTAGPAWRAQQHLHAADLGLKLDQERLQSIRDAVALRQLLKTDSTPGEDAGKTGSPQVR